MIVGFGCSVPALMATRTLEEERDRRLAELDVRIQRTREKFDEDVSERLDPLIKEGQKMETSLREKQGSTIRVPIEFEATRTQIADKGTTIGPKHLSILQKAVKSRLEEIEDELKEKRDRAIEKIKGEVDKVRAEAEESLIALRNQLEDQAQTVQIARHLDFFPAEQRPLWYGSHTNLLSLIHRGLHLM